MKFIINILKKWVTKGIPQTPILGRWKIEGCSVKINSKIDWSNEDHCGPCGQYALYKLAKTQTKIVTKRRNNIQV